MDMMDGAFGTALGHEARGGYMNPGLALIVDDSKTAQHLLKRMLQKFNLKIDTASSAEEALAYLSYNHPAVIFLDQHMTGMTGIEALKTIKANPHTALIPVVMYTSLQDDLFVSQAIALGAQDILSKGAMQPANLERVLKVLNIQPIAESNAEAGIKAEPPLIIPKFEVPATVPTKEQAMQDLDRVRSQIGRLFEIHIADVRTQINNSTQFIVKRLLTSFEKNADRDGFNGSESLSTVKTAVKDVVAAEGERIAFAFNLLFVTIVIGMVFLGGTLWHVQDELKQVSKNYLADGEAKKAAAPVMATPVNLTLPDNAENRATNAALLSAIGWLQNADFQFNYGEQPLNDLQVSNLNKLLNILAEAGYKGSLIVDINFGNVCLEASETNTWRLARSDMPVTACKMLRDLNPKFTATDYITVPFQSLEKTALPIQDGRITLRLVSSGLSTPRVEYPVIRTSTTAGEWNSIALRNNRISIQLGQ